MDYYLQTFLLNSFYKNLFLVVYYGRLMVNNGRRMGTAEHPHFKDISKIIK